MIMPWVFVKVNDESEEGSSSNQRFPDETKAGLELSYDDDRIGFLKFK